MPKKNQISFTKPSDPSFLRALKQQIGYTDGPSLEDKVSIMDFQSRTKWNRAIVTTSLIFAATAAGGRVR